MITEMTGAEPPLSPASILDLPTAKEGRSLKDWRKLQKKIQPCSECNKERDCEFDTQAGYGTGKCYWCWITWFGLNFFNWVACPQCGIDWSKLKENGLCVECDKKKFDELEKRKKTEEKLTKIFGSIAAMNHFTFERFKITTQNHMAFEKLKGFDCKKHNVYLHGKCGTGKTHLAYACAKIYALKESEVVISTPLRLVDSFRTKSEIEKEDRFQEFTECDLLLIDDLGISKHTDFAIEVLNEILNRRALQLKNGLIVTSNLSLDHLANKNIDDRVPSRLAGLCEVIEIVGEDYRLR